MTCTGGERARGGGSAGDDHEAGHTGNDSATRDGPSRERVLLDRDRTRPALRQHRPDALREVGSAGTTRGVQQAPDEFPGEGPCGGFFVEGAVDERRERRVEPSQGRLVVDDAT